MFPATFRKVSSAFAACLGQTSVGIDIVRDAVRVVALRRGREGVCLAGLGSASMLADAPAAAIREALRSACRRIAWRPRRVVLAIPADAVLVRVLQTEHGAGPEEQAEAVERAARLIPVPAAELRLAWSPTDVVVDQGLAPSVAATAADATSERQVCMVAARRQDVLERQTLATVCGLGRVVIDVDLFAAMRGLQGLCDPRVAVAPWSAASLPMLVDGGTASLRALIWPRGGPPLLRVVPAPRPADAETLGASIADLAGELAGSSGTTPDAVLVAGGVVPDDAVLEAIARHTGLPARFVDPFAGIPGDTSGKRPPAGAPAAAWLTACGLALRGLA